MSFSMKLIGYSNSSLSSQKLLHIHYLIPGDTDHKVVKNSRTSLWAEAKKQLQMSFLGLGLPLIIFVSVSVGCTVLMVIFSIIHCICIKANNSESANKPPASDSRPVAAEQVVEVIWKAGQTMERFLQDIERENPVSFTSQQLNNFTSNYSTRLGFGGFGEVYKGQFPNGVKIAVKVINRNLGKIAEEQFMAEVGTIGRTYHINLVRLYGFCHDQHMTALVYEYMENGSLDRYLFGNIQAIEWEKLHEIAIGTAKGLAYLHEECQQRIIHYDIKPENVFLDGNFSPKVADFGLAKLCDRNRTRVSISGYKGTPGYSAPEFLTGNYPITHKCDVYSCGMVLFEIVGRRRNMCGRNMRKVNWVQWYWLLGLKRKPERKQKECVWLLCGVCKTHLNIGLQ